jgi:thiol-disulfide isomerase/thioredoxin
MRKAAAALLMLSLPPFLLLFSCAREAPKVEPRAEKGRPAPEFTVYGPEGDAHRLSDYRGSVVLVNFWATWCDSCKLEKPSLVKLYNGLRNSPDFRLVTVLVKDDPAKARAYLSGHGYDIPFFTDPGNKAYILYGLTGVPESFIIDKNGVLREKVIGPINWDSPEVLSFMEDLIRQ